MDLVFGRIVSCNLRTRKKEVVVNKPYAVETFVYCVPKPCSSETLQYCGESDSIDHIFIYCNLTQQFTINIVQWFNEVNKCNFNQGLSEILFGVRNTQDNLVKKLNYTLLFLRNHIYKCKFREDSLLLPDFINKFMEKYKIMRICDRLVNE